MGGSLPVPSKRGLYQVSDKRHIKGEIKELNKGGVIEGW